MPMRIETSSIEIGSSAMSTVGSTASARAIATRWRCPPDSSCGYFAANFSPGVKPTVSSSSCTRSSIVPRVTTVDPQRPGNVVPHGLDGVQRTERILEDHLHLRAVANEVAPPMCTRDVAALEVDAPGGRVVEPREQSCDRALAAAALADERGDRAGPEREVHVVDRVHATAASEQSVAGREVLRQSVHLERRGDGSRHDPSSSRWQAARWPGASSRRVGRTEVWSA